MFYNSKRKLNFYLLGLLGSLTVTLSSYAANPIEQVCVKPVFGIGYAVVMKNMITHESQRTSLAEGTKCVAAKVTDSVCYSVFWGKEIGCHTVGPLKEENQIPLGGALEVSGLMWDPKGVVVASP